MSKRLLRWSSLIFEDPGEGLTGGHRINVKPAKLPILEKNEVVCFHRECKS